jgi:hypothetical protein
MKKHWKPLVLSVFLSCGQQALATETHTPTKVLNAIFVSFQPVDIFTLDEISAARSTVIASANMGDPEAAVVAQKFEQAPIQIASAVTETRLTADPVFALIAGH